MMISASGSVIVKHIRAPLHPIRIARTNEQRRLRLPAVGANDQREARPRANVTREATQRDSIKLMNGPTNVTTITPISPTPNGASRSASNPSRAITS
jgi:hypothetical protein